MGTWIAFGVIALLVVFAIMTYNSLVSRRVACQAAWSQIDVQRKRRYDLVPNLVETVKGYAAHERQTLEAVIAARNTAADAKGIQERAEAENMLTGALRQLFALSEAYPDLKANQNFMQLQEELTSTENRIAFSRQHYNSTCAEYNATTERFPSNVLANMFGFKKQEYFQIEDPEHRQGPQVKF